MQSRPVLMLFSGHKFIVELGRATGELSDNDSDGEQELGDLNLKTLIEENGGTIIDWRDRLDGKNAPHLIVVAQTTSFSHYNELENLMVPTVKPAWVMQCVTAQKLVPTRPYSPDPKKVLSDVIICCAGLSRGDSDALEAGVRALGGDWTEVPTKFTTHVVTLDPKHPHAEIARDSGLDINIVSPEWIDDCMKLQRKLDDSCYLVSNDESQGGDQSANSSTASAAANGSAGALAATFDAGDSENHNPRLAVQRSMRSALGSSIFENKAFFLATDLDISLALHKTVVFLIETNGGQVVDELGLAAVFLGKWRMGDEYKEACSRRLTVGNLTWLYWMAIQQRWESPLRHLLHYPEVKDGMPEMRGAVIAITNYTGDSRMYLHMLIKALGAKYSGTLIEGVSTHLIAAHTDGAKCQAAVQWNIPVVNHLWLEETYSNWQVQSTSLPRYTHYPKKLDLSTLIGYTSLAPQALKQFFDSKPAMERQPRHSRAARDKAEQMLHANVLKENEFQRQRKTHDLPKLQEESIPATKTSPKKTPPSAGKKRARPVPAATDTTASTEEESPAPAGKQKRPRASAGQSSAQPGLLDQPATESSGPLLVTITGIDGPPVKTKLAKIGIKAVENKAQVLVAPRVLRTPKFLTALAHADHVVSEGWLQACIQSQSVAPFDEFEIGDSQLTETLTRAKELRANKKFLFSGLSFWLDSQVKAGPHVVGQIIKAHGGKVTDRRTETTIEIHKDGTPGQLCLEDIITAILAMAPIQPITMD